MDGQKWLRSGQIQSQKRKVKPLNRRETMGGKGTLFFISQQRATDPFSSSFYSQNVSNVTPPQNHWSRNPQKRRKSDGTLLYLTAETTTEAAKRPQWAPTCKQSSHICLQGEVAGQNQELCQQSSLRECYRLILQVNRKLVQGDIRAWFIVHLVYFWGTTP